MTAVDGEIRFWRQDDTGAAAFDFGEIADWELADGKVTFADGAVGVSSFVVPATAPSNLVFVGGEGTVLTAVTQRSIFEVTAESGQIRRWQGIGFENAVEKDDLHQDGGAIRMTGGGFEITDCAFANCMSYELGGAIAALALTDDSVVSNSTFTANVAEPFGNGMGGAIYATAADEGVRLTLADSTFEGNLATIGGAVATVPIGAVDDEFPIGLVIDDCLFDGNAAEYNGGAIAAEGSVDVQSGETLFANNTASCAGGAIDVYGFEGDTFAPTAVSIGRGVTFAENVVSNANAWVQGGAISFSRPEGSLAAEGVMFSENRVYGSAADQGAAGGALALENMSDFAVEVCVFVGNDVLDANGGPVADGAVWGGAADVCGATGLVQNCTFRGSSIEAVSCVDSSVGVTNCVIVDNGRIEGFTDLYAVDSDVPVEYSAYGKAVGVSDGNCNLTNLTAESVYAGDTPRLNMAGFNPVVELGLVQPEVKDFDGNRYESTGSGTFEFPRPRTSMGAFVEETDRILVLDVFGVKDYDSTTRSNGCVWTWKLTDTNGADVAYDDLVPTNLTPAEASAYLAERFAITNWVFGTEENGGAVGLYDSTNETGSAWYLDGGVKALSERIDWLGAVLTLRAHGEIENTWFILPVDFGGGETNHVYFTWDWMKGSLGRFPTNDFEESCGILREAEPNGYPRWQNYVMGIDGTNPSNRIVTTYAPSTDSAKRASCVDVVTPIASFVPPKKVGVAAEYRLYNVTHTRRGILPDTSDEKWYCYDTNPVPRFVNFDLSKIRYGLKDLSRDYGQCLLEIYAIFKAGEKPEGAE